MSSSSGRPNPRWAAVGILAVVWLATVLAYVALWRDLQTTPPTGLVAGWVLASHSYVPAVLWTLMPNVVLLGLGLPLGLTRQLLPWEDRPTLRLLIAVWTALEGIIAILAFAGGPTITLSASAAVGAILSLEGIRLTLLASVRKMIGQESAEAT